MRYALRAVQRDIHAARRVHGDGKLSTIGATGLIVGPFEPDVYWAAEQLVRAQSEALRSSLCDAPECGYQVVHDSAPVSPMLFNVSGAADPAASAHAWIERDFSVPFAADGLVVASRHVLFKLGEQEHLVYCKYDHALFDGWGTSLFATRLGIAYSRIIAGEVVQPVVEVSTAEMLEDEHAYLASPRHAADREYWLQRMQRYAGGYFTPATSLVNRRIVLGLDQQEMSALKHWTNAEQVGAFHFFVAVLHATLFRLVAARDLSIGLPILNRRNAREKQTIGLFLGFCCLRALASPSMSVAELARSVAVQMKADFRHQRYPLEAIASETGGLPFEVSLSYEKHDYNVALAGSPAFVTPLQTPAQAYALKVFVRDFDYIRPIFIDFDVNDSCFGGLSPELLVETFQAVMRQALASPATQLLSIRPMQVPPTVRAQRQDTGVVVTDLCSEFERMAARTPAAVAVRGASGALDYAQLDAHANTLAASLRALDVGPEARVGLCGTRDIHFVIGMLGILKTGAAYVPLDLAYPAERLDFLIADSGVMALVGEAADLGRLPAHALPCCVIDPQEQPAAQSAAQPRRIAPQQAAYVIYTSGSTGTPKGCVITHANVLRLFEVSAAPFALGPTDVWSVFHSTAFDFSVWEIWGALLHGGSAVFVPYETSRDPQAFAAFMQQQRVSVLSQTPSAFRLLAEQPGLLPDLRLVVFGGEALESSSLREWFVRYGDQRPQLVNMYGITETTVHVTARVLGSTDVGGALCPIGEPLADLSLQLLDSYGEPVLPGVTGEIYVGGAGVARGYLNRPGLTATRFVPDPYGPPGSRRYRSGDLARRRADGETEYLGRADQQVKIRGFRIEPAEIEAALRLHPAVRDAAVVCERSAQGEMRLIGYVSAVAAEELEGLRAHLVAQLPAHMVPAHLIRLDTLPLTHNGKLDRGALPAPETLAPHAHEAPATPTEKLLASIWARVLGVTPNRNDNFFALGGDSILSLTIVKEARTAGLALSPVQLLTGPTLRSLAADLDRQPSTPGTIAAAVPILPFSQLDEADRRQMPSGFEDAFPMTRLQLGMLFHSERDGGAVFHDIFRYWLRVTWNEAAWQASVTAHMRAHAALRTVFALEGFSVPLQQVRDATPAALQIFDLRALNEPAREAALHSFVEEQRRHRFDIRNGPLFRLFLHRLSDDVVHLTLSFHHAILDGWSVASLMTGIIGEACGRASAQRAVDTPLLAAHAAAERAALADTVLRDAWRERLARWPATLFAAASSDALVVPRMRTVEKIALRLPEETSAMLVTRAQQVGVALRSVLLAAHVRVLSVLSGSDRPSTGYVVHNRSDQAGSTEAVGLFLNTVPFSMPLVPGSWADLIRRVAREELQLGVIRRLPLQAIVDEGAGARLFDVAFNYVHFHVYGRVIDLPDLEVLGFDAYEETDFPLLVQFTRNPSDGCIEISLHYDTAYFAAPDVARHLAALDGALNHLACNPDLQWLDTPLLEQKPADPPTVRAQRQDTGVVVTDLCSEFERMAARTPAAVAVRGASGALDYAQLDAHANTLAASLRALDVGPEARVGLCGTRDIHFVIGMLGILKTGAAYVPLDLAYPAERLDFLIADSGVMALVGEAADLGRLPAHALPCCVIDPQEQPAAQSAAQPRRIAPQQAAYVIYTSGSTGTPKGCVITHANVLRLFEVSAAPFALGPTDVWSVFHSTAFDFSVWEIWGALLHGGSAVFVPYETSRDPQAFAAFMQQQRVSVLSQTPSAFRLLAEQPGLLPDLRLVVFGGEALESSSLREWFVRYGDQRPQLVNMYGITETTVHVTARVLGSTDVGGALCPIGEPLADLSLQLLDSYGEPVLPGVTGEIYVGGAGVARGYLNRPGLTATRFVPDPYGPPGSRRYRSGDLARRRADGETEYLGRADQQVKIRGFRIEPAEIEAALRLHPAVRDAAVVCERSAQGEMRLIGYVSAVAAEELEGLRAHLVAQLPAHMVPAHLIRLDTLPLTHNGKLDRGALPAPETLAPHAHEAPATPTEKLLASIWARVLGVTPNRNDNFFALGGDSILSLRMVNEVRSAIGRAIPLQGIFSAASLRGFAAWLDTLPASATADTDATPTVRRAARRRVRVELEAVGSEAEGSHVLSDQYDT